MKGCLRFAVYHNIRYDPVGIDTGNGCECNQQAESAENGHVGLEQRVGGR